MDQQPNLPSKIHLGPYSYQVEQVDFIDAADPYKVGWCDQLQLKVKLRRDLPHDLQRANVLHEALHVVEDVFHLGLTDEGDMTDRWSVAILTLFDSNPELLSFLFPQRWARSPKEEEPGARTDRPDPETH